MVDYTELMRILSVSRPNGSRAETETRHSLQDWLEKRQIPYRLQPFRLYPYFFISIGAWTILSRTLLAVAIWLRWGWPTLLIALVGLSGGFIDVALDFPLVGWPGARQGNNLLVEFDAENARREVVISAHYDSKTELLDHHQRMFFIRNLSLGIVLTVLLGVLGLVDWLLLERGSAWAGFIYGAGVALSLPLLFLAWGLGLNLSMGWLRRNPSQGAVDNGAACAILLGLAERVAHGELKLMHTRLILALFTGEEVNMQGSRAYALGRSWSLPAIALNLEVMAQNGDYVYWEQDGTSLKLVPASAEVNHRIVEAVAEVTGTPARPAGPVNSDGYSFLRAGIPATTLGTYDRVLVDRGFHLPTDNLNRVVMERLPEAVEILTRFVRQYDQQRVMNP
jgi:hypothetical protein